jgi:hypothetical protein
MATTPYISYLFFFFFYVSLYLISFLGVFIYMHHIQSALLICIGLHLLDPLYITIHKKRVIYQHLVASFPFFFSILSLMCSLLSSHDTSKSLINPLKVVVYILNISRCNLIVVIYSWVPQAWSSQHD